MTQKHNAHDYYYGQEDNDDISENKLLVDNSRGADSGDIANATIEDGFDLILGSDLIYDF